MYRSQNNEVEVVANYFEGQIGTLLSIGENNGLDFSNAYDLIQSGWRGILVEPGESAFDKLQYLHKYNHNVCCYNFGIGELSAPEIFYSASDTLLSTRKVELLERWETVTHEPTVTMFFSFKDALKQFALNKFEFITIDAEGMDWDILSQMDLNNLGCRCICVEHNSVAAIYDVIKAYCTKFGLNKEILYNNENVIMAR